MSTTSLAGTCGLAAMFSCFALVHASETEPAWRQTLEHRLPLLGHRNWIVIADSAYPLQSREGIETIATEADHFTVLRTVLAMLRQSKHVRPIVYLDAELPFVADDDAPGIAAYRHELDKILKNQPPKSLSHEKVIAKLDQSARTFHVLILKTNMALPYTSVFIELDCGYWSSEAEDRLRNYMQRAHATENSGPVQ